MRKILMMAGLFIFTSSIAVAADNFKPKAFDFGRMYFGAGVSSNEITDTGLTRTVRYDRANGYQILVGYDLGMRAKDFRVLVEVGYQDSGEFKGKVKATSANADERLRGPWASAIVSYEFVPRFDGFLRLGYDGGDDKGLMMGAGVGYKIIKNFTLRLEGVSRNDTNSLQVNAIFHP